MPHLLKNKYLEVQIDLPHEGYRFSRFDWTGKITDLRFLGTNFLSQERLDCPDENLIGKGLYNEFGMQEPLGFREANIGDYCHKIGLGLIKKAEPNYHFLQAYEVVAADFSHHGDQQELKIVCRSPRHLGYAYRLEKVISLAEAQLNIAYHLKNLGEKIIHTEEYNHNFLAIGARKVDAQYQLDLSFAPAAKDFEEYEDPTGVLGLHQRSVKLQEQSVDPFFIGRLNGEKKAPANWSLYHRGLGLGLQERGDFLASKINLWGWGHVISPEVFHEIRLAPGESSSWNRSYTFFKR